MPYQRDNSIAISKYLSVFILLLLFLRPSFSSSLDRAVDFITFLFLFVIILSAGIKIKSEHKFWVSFNALFLIIMLFSFLNGALHGFNTIIRDYFEFYRPVFNAILLIIGGYLLMDYEKYFLKLLKIVLIVQAIFIFLQLTNIGNFINSPISSFYSMEKVSLGVMRVVGTYANPNALGIMLNLIFFYLFFYYSQNAVKKRKNVYILFIVLTHIALVFASSSRTAFLAMLTVYLILLLTGKINIGKNLKFLAYPSMIVGLYIFIVNIDSILNSLNRFRYMFELFGGNILEIRAIQLRLDHFEKMFNIINEYPLLSIGAKKSIIDVGDNDYIFTLFQWGIVGFIIKYTMFVYLFFKVKRSLKFTSSESEWFVYGTLTSIFMLFIAGLTGESFYNYKYLTIILINAGYCLSMYSNRIYYETNFKNRHFVPPEYELQFK